MKFVLNRDRVISSLCGLSVEFRKGEPTHVPPAMYAEVIAAGGVAEDEVDLDPNKSTEPVAPTDPEARRDALYDAFEQIALRGQRDDFTASGAPHAKAVSKLLGWRLDNKERDAAWAAFQLRGKE
jgi:hypothetical protein